MVQMWVDGRQLAEVGRMLGLPLNRTENNYLTHCLLGKLFGDYAPRPFHLEDDPQREEKREYRVLGYSSGDKDQLQSHAQITAEPGLYDDFDFDRLKSKPIPDSFPEDQRYAFELRACPVIRKSSSGPKWSEGQEVDAFLSRVWEIDDESVNVEREDVYRDWLLRQFDIRGGAEPVGESISLTRFSIEEMVRRTQGEDRSVRSIKRPDVTLEGLLTTTDGERFHEVLFSGIGQHKSFGFGMVKLRSS